MGECNNHTAIIHRGKWGNSSTPAWKIKINGQDEGTELTLRDAKLEAERVMIRKGLRAGF